MPTEPAALPAGLSATAFSSLFQAVNGLRNRRALVALIGCTAAGVLVASLLVMTGGALGFLAGLLAFVVYVVAVGTGINAAGLLHMDEARGISPRSTVDALVQGLMCIPKLIVLGLAFIAVEIAVFIAIAVLLLICKIPFLGPLLFTVAFPLSVVVAGATVCGLFLCMALSLPAIWQNATIGRALTQTLAIARSRLVETLLLLVFVGLLCFAVGFVVFGVLMTGVFPVIALSASIVGFGGGGDFGSVMGMMQGYGGGGLAMAGFIGGALLWAAAGSLVAQVWLLGLCIVYLRVTEGLDLSATEAALRETLDEARRRTAELGEKARSAASGEGAAAAPTAAAPTAAAPTAAVTTSPAAATPAAPSPTTVAPAAALPMFDAPVTPSWHDDTMFDVTAGPEVPVTSLMPYEAAAPAVPHPPSEPPAVAPPPSGDADIALPFDDDLPPSPVAATHVAPTAHASPPAYMPPPAPAPVAAPPAIPVSTTCSQCLSSVTADDVFCGVCGYRLR
jgi:hypothetical protein